MRDDQEVLGPCTLRMTKSKNCVIIFFQYNLSLPRCTFSKAVPVSLFLQNRNPFPPPPPPHQHPSTHKQHQWPSLLPKFLARRLVFRFAIRKKSEGATSREWGVGVWGKTSKLHLVAAAIATWWAGALSYKSNTPQVNFPLLFFTISWHSHLSSSA